MMKAIALLGAPKDQWPTDLTALLKQARQNGEFLIGVDRGSILLRELGLKPDLAVGDFDSLKPQELSQIEQTVADIRYSVPEKDLTDTELMIRYAFEDYGVEFLTLFGSTGGRLDHFMNNLLMVLKPEFSAYTEKIAIVDQQNEIQFYRPGIYTVKKLPGYKYFGVINLTPVQNLNISEAKYHLTGYNSPIPVSFGSNEFLPASETFNLACDQGVLAVIQSKDLDRYQNI